MAMVPEPDRNVDSSKIGNHLDSNFGFRFKSRTCFFTWNIEIPSEFGRRTSGKLSSPTFSSVYNDLKWHLECSNRLSTSGNRIIFSIALNLHDENDLFEKYDTILGDVHLDGRTYQGTQSFIKGKTFEIFSNTEVSPCVVFPEVIDYSWANNWVFPENNQLVIVCKIAYVTFKKKMPINSTSSLSDNLENLLSDKEFSDVTIKVRSNEYPVYKGILAARSPVFKAMFRKENGMQENTTNVVNIPDIRPEVFEEMLLFIYTGKVKNVEKLVYELLPAADQYELKELMKICEDTLVKQLSKDNVIKTLILAHTHHVNGLKQKALQFVKLHSRYADLKNTAIWNVLTSYNDLMEDLVAVLLD